jgi:hypothetical protein
MSASTELAEFRASKDRFFGHEKDKFRTTTATAWSVFRSAVRRHR